jgi:tol-pal system protein YbgF
MRITKKSFVLMTAVVLMSGFALAKPQDAASGADSVSTTVENHGRSIATMTNQVNEMVGQFQTMQGDLGKAEKKNLDQDKLIKDSQLRLQTLEDRIGVLTQQMTELKTEGLLKPTATQRLSEFEAYSKALEFVNAKNYAKAILDLQTFQNTYKKSPFATYAQYWIGEAYYLQSDYEMAISEYQKLLGKDARSQKAAAALYKQGLSFFHLQSFDDAKEFFSKVIRNYPQSIEAVQSSSQIQRINSIMELRKQEEMERLRVDQANQNT